MKPSQESYVPSYPDFIVDFRPGEFSSGLKAKKVSSRASFTDYLLTVFKAFEAGDFLVKFEGLTKSEKTYTSVQCGRGSEDHVELNSDLVYGTDDRYFVLLLLLRDLRNSLQSITPASRMLRSIFPRMTALIGTFAR
jgi:hypothetical protein